MVKKRGKEQERAAAGSRKPGDHRPARSWQARAWQAAVAAPGAPSNLSSGDERFKSCVQPPLFYSNDLDEHVSRTPLHVTLGQTGPGGP